KTHDVDNDLRPREPHREHRYERLPARDHARVFALGREHFVRIGERLGAHVIEPRRLHARPPNNLRSQAKKPEVAGPSACRASAAKNWRMTSRVAPSSSRPPIAATLPPISAS